MVSLKQYLAENEIIHEFRVKLAVEPTDEALDAMELHLRKYEGFDITTPKKTIMHRNPRDFNTVDAAEIFMIDFKTKQPASPTQLLAELCQKMKVHEKYMIVRNKKEPLHVEDEDKEKKTDEYKSRLEDADYSEYDDPKADDYYGEKFKENFLKGLTKTGDKK